MSKGRIIFNLFVAVVGGVAITCGMFMLLGMFAGCGNSTPLVERLPIAWVFLWPTLLLPEAVMPDVAFGVIMGSNALLYTSLIYFVLHRRCQPLKLP